MNIKGMFNWKNKVLILKDVLIGNLLKIRVLWDIHICKSVRLSELQDSSVVISLTSYGERVKRSVIYTVYSLLKQSLRAERVVLWLNEDEYQYDSLPSNLKFLCSYGLEVRFCKDIRSYTKVIYSFSTFPEKNIITVDDDLYYSKDFVAAFMRAHRENPHTIITGVAKIPYLNNAGKMASYVDWQEIKKVQSDSRYNRQTLFPLGVWGVLYPPHIFDEEVKNESVFLSLCPKADDVWLFVTGLRCHVDKQILSDSTISYYQIDLLRQVLLKDRLTASNRFEGENDVQLRALLEYYNIPLNIFTS